MCTKKRQEGGWGGYRRGDNDEDAEVDNQSNVEEGEVAEGGHLLPIGVD